MRKALTCAVATAAVAAVAAAGTTTGAGFTKAATAIADRAVTPSKASLPPVEAPSASPSASPSGTVGAASNGGSTQNSSSDASSSFVQPNSYTFRTINDPADPTFNQLLGINNDGVVAGYFGSGAQGHPNMGFRVGSGSSSFVAENVPGSVQTQVTAIDNQGVTVGFRSTMNNANQMNDNTGFYDLGGYFHQVAYPTSNKSTPAVDQLLGVNDSEVAVGFYTDANGNNHGYEYNIGRHSYHLVTVSGATSTTAAAINNDGDVAGFFTGGGATEGFLLTAYGKLTKLAYPGASMTQALGVNSHDEVVGLYQVGSGDNVQTHGFTWTAKGSFQSVDDPSGVGTTSVNGVNDAGDLVGFYVDGAGNTDGMLATPSSGNTGGTGTVHHLKLAAMPTGTVTLSRDWDGVLKATVTASGLTPGSSHTVEIDAPGYKHPVASFSSTLTADATGNAKATLEATDYTYVPDGSRFVIRLAVTDGNSTNNALAAEPIARSGGLYDPYIGRGRASNLTAVDVNENGDSLGSLTGRSTIVYNAAKQTLTVTVNATGLTPGAHAAHIHAGSCQSQGGVLYMMMDFQADQWGNVSNEARVITGVTSLPANGAWYLNLHLGDSNTIVANGAPALPFRPLLCANG
jgi:hypothetical protein